MKVKVLSHSPQEVFRERKQDLPKLQHNPDPILHPFEQQRELTRAVNAAKLERLFAKPFIGSLAGHTDGVYSLAKHAKNLTCILSGSADGELRLWDIGNSLFAHSKATWVRKAAHTKFIRGVAFLQNGYQYNHGKVFLSCSDDASVKLWDLSSSKNANWSDPYCARSYAGNHPFTAIDHHAQQNIFATSGGTVDIWQHDRQEPIQTYNWGHDTFTNLRFNMSESNILAACATDRSISLFDLRLESPLTKIFLSMKSNSVCWNPMEPVNFAVANEDNCIYSFDMRKMGQGAANIMKDHVSAVLDIDFSPTGQELVSGAYDRSIRIFNTRSGHSRDIYHTKRMQKVFCVKYTMDSKYILSGSDDGNIRVWRAQASQRMGYSSSRQQRALQYNQALQQKYQDIDEVKRIRKNRHVPKFIVSAQKERRIMEASRKRKESNRRRHAPPNTVPFEKKRQTPIVKVEK